MIFWGEMKILYGIFVFLSQIILFLKNSSQTFLYKKDSQEKMYDHISQNNFKTYSVIIFAQKFYYQWYQFCKLNPHKKIFIAINNLGNKNSMTIVFFLLEKFKKSETLLFLLTNFLLRTISLHC